MFLRTRDWIADQDAEKLIYAPSVLASALYKLQKYSSYLAWHRHRFRFIYTAERVEALLAMDGNIVKHPAYAVSPLQPSSEARRVSRQDGSYDVFRRRLCSSRVVKHTPKRLFRSRNCVTCLGATRSLLHPATVTAEFADSTLLRLTGCPKFLALLNGSVPSARRDR